MAEQEYKCHCGNCQIRIYIQRDEGVVLTWQDCPFTCPYATEMRCLTEAKENTTDDSISRQAAIDAFKKELTDGESKGNYVTICSAVSYEGAKQILERLPPAPSEPIRINLNESIKVKLTDLGKEIYYHQYDRVNQIAGREICKPKFPKEDENGYTEFQLWCFIELYGEHVGMTLPNVIEPLEIVYER